ncbi:unnamed protein product [Symbiodinium natans]|uniref:Uncharacterized protein n=1 Tax=Symbiodinium natans TaxID=878477 RepID=A0A812UCX4_9DINO|nr:unnamed protein product [Symbiodinium natans]
MEPRRALGLPESLAPTAARMTELLHDTDDRVARAANLLSMKRLRLIASPHPSINSQAAEALRSRGVLVGSSATWFFGMEGIQHQFPLVLEELSKAANAGALNHWFGGPRAGRYAVVTTEELWQWGMMNVFQTLHFLQDQLQMVLDQMGEEGRRLRESLGDSRDSRDIATRRPTEHFHDTPFLCMPCMLRR